MQGVVNTGPSLSALSIRKPRPVYNLKVQIAVQFRNILRNASIKGYLVNPEIIALAPSNAKIFP